jgi:hypothetical protein
VRLTRAAIALALCFSGQDCPAQVTVQVLSRPRLSASVLSLRQTSECQIEGSLVDDLGLPLANAELEGTLELRRASTLPDGATIGSCDQFANPTPQPPKISASTRTNEAGQFCFHVQTNAPQPGAKVTIQYPGGVGYESIESQVSLIGSTSPPSLRLLNSPNRIMIDEKNVALGLELSAAGRETGGLPVTLALVESAFRERQSKESVLMTSRTDTEGVVRFAIPGTKFGTPGTCVLVARFEGLQDLPSASLTWPIMRTGVVQLQTHPEATETEVGDFANVLAVATSNCGAVPEGSIEFSLDQSSQVALPLINGQVRWQFSTYLLAPGNVTIRARYVATSAAWTGEAQSSVNLHIKPISNRRRALWLTSGLLILIWFVFRGRPLDKGSRARTSGASSAPAPQSLEVEPSSIPNFGWVGIVIDSHTGLPVDGATVSIEQPGFSETRTELQVCASIDGTFTLPHWDSLPVAKLVVAAPKYLRAQWTLPKPGRLAIRLETRRRAIVRAFVNWADKAERGKAPCAEPTPGQIAQVAHRQALTQVNVWASRVQVAAFGPIEPSLTDDELMTPPESDAFGTNRSQ